MAYSKRQNQSTISGADQVKEIDKEIEVQKSLLYELILQEPFEYDVRNNYANWIKSKGIDKDRELMIRHQHYFSAAINRFQRRKAFAELRAIVARCLKKSSIDFGFAVKHNFGLAGNGFDRVIGKDCQIKLWLLDGFISGIMIPRQMLCDYLDGRNPFPEAIKDPCKAFPLRGIVAEGMKPQIEIVGEMSKNRVYFWRPQKSFIGGSSLVHGSIYSRLRAPKIYQDSEAEQAVYPSKESALLDFEQAALNSMRARVGFKEIEWKEADWTKKQIKENSEISLDN